MVLVTGASSGLGRATATHLHARGYRVYGTSRRGPDGADVPYPLIALDVTDEASAQAAVERVLRDAGRLDVLVNNAGNGIAGAVEDTPLADAQAQMDANFFGALRMIRAVLPPMRAQSGGTIVNVSSMAGLVGVPYQGMYSASKYALEGLSEALRVEVAPFGVRVVLVEPGDFRTGFTGSRRWVPGGQASVYGEPASRAVAVMAADEQNGADPARVGRLIARIIEHPRPRVRYLVGKPAQVWLMRVLRLLPRGLGLRLLARYYGRG